MPNGGIPLGCLPCNHFDKEENSLRGRCKLHDIPTSMHEVCADLHNPKYMINSKLLPRKLEKNTLYSWIDILNQEGYPPPRQLTPMASIAEYQQMTEEERQQCFEDAKKLADELFHKEINEDDDKSQS